MISSIILAVPFVLVGCACSWVGHRFKNTTQARSDKNTGSPQLQLAPVYEEVQPTFTSQDQETAFQLNDNIAYGPLYL